MFEIWVDNCDLHPFGYWFDQGGCFYSGSGLLFWGAFLGSISTICEPRFEASIWEREKLSTDFHQFGRSQLIFIPWKPVWGLSGIIIASLFLQPWESTRLLRYGISTDLYAWVGCVFDNWVWLPLSLTCIPISPRFKVLCPYPGWIFRGLPVHFQSKLA